MTLAYFRTRYSALVFLSLCGCHHYTQVVSPIEGVTRARSGPIAVTRTDHSVVRMKAAIVARDSIVGVADDGSNAPVAVALKDVSGVARREVDVGRSVALGGGVILGSLGALFIAALIAFSHARID